MARNGENIYKRKDGRWEGRYNKGKKANGKTLYGSVYGKKYSEVRAKLLPLKLEYATRHMVEKDVFNGTVQQWVCHWLEYLAKPRVKPATYASYRHKIEKYILPALGQIKLTKLAEKDIQNFIAHLQEYHFAQSSIVTILRILNSALNSAVEKNLLYRSPCKNVHLALPHKTQIKALTRSEQKALEKAAFSQNACPASILGLYTGLRIGEISALKWENVNLEKGELTVQHTLQRVATFSAVKAKSKIIIGAPKSRSSCRVIPLAPHLLAFLRKEHAKASGEYVISCKGSYAEPRVISQRFAKLLRNAGVAHTNFHSLRHTFATRCLEQGVDITTLNYLMGHSSVKVTLDTYTDSMPEQRKAALRKVDHLLRWAIVKEVSA